MTQKDFLTVAGGDSNRQYPANWLSKIVIEQLDEGLLLHLVDQAIKEHDAFLDCIKQLRGAWLDPDRTLHGNPVPALYTDKLYAAFDEIKMLKDVRTRLVNQIDTSTPATEVEA